MGISVPADSNSNNEKSATLNTSDDSRGFPRYLATAYAAAL